MAEQIRQVVQYELSDDPLPLHPDFYKFIQEDEEGNLFIQDKNGNRWKIEYVGTD